MPIKNQNGLSLVELIVVIVIISIISMFTVISAGRYLESSKQKGDIVTLNSINDATQLFMYTGSEEEVNSFNEQATDDDKLTYLFSNGLLSSYPDSLIESNVFQYDSSSTQWTLNGSDGSITYTETSTEYFTVSGSKISGYDTDGGLSIVIPKEIDGTVITEIGQDSFKGLGLTSVVIQEGVTRISGNSFHSNNLTSVVIPSTVTKIWHNAFYGNNLRSVTIGSSVTSIEGGAFSNNSLSSITLPPSVTFVGAGAFGYGNNYITSVTIGSNVTISNTASLGIYGNTFKTFYDVEKAAGTYTYSDGVWSK